MRRSMNLGWGPISPDALFGGGVAFVVGGGSFVNEGKYEKKTTPTTTLASS
jgi:hypothetical protein